MGGMDARISPYRSGFAGRASNGLSSSHRARRRPPHRPPAGRPRPMVAERREGSRRSRGGCPARIARPRRQHPTPSCCAGSPHACLAPGRRSQPGRRKRPVSTRGKRGVCAAGAGGRRARGVGCGTHDALFLAVARVNTRSNLVARSLETATAAQQHGHSQAPRPDAPQRSPIECAAQLVREPIVLRCTRQLGWGVGHASTPPCSGCRRRRALPLKCSVGQPHLRFDADIPDLLYVSSLHVDLVGAEGP
jgi:hypothetical protein